jgi:hypothetical protein
MNAPQLSRAVQPWWVGGSLPNGCCQCTLPLLAVHPARVSFWLAVLAVVGSDLQACRGWVRQTLLAVRCGGLWFFVSGHGRGAGGCAFICAGRPDSDSESSAGRRQLGSPEAHCTVVCHLANGVAQPRRRLTQSCSGGAIL